MHVSKHGPDSARVRSLSLRRLGAPRPSVQILKEKLVHAIIGRVGFEQNGYSLIWLRRKPRWHTGLERFHGYRCLDEIVLG